MSKYYLVARNISNNDVSVLPIQESWYIKNGSNEKKKANSIEAIDLVTSRFSDKDSMAKRLIENKYISEGQYDFFICSEVQDRKVRIFEPIYNRKDDRNNEFRSIAFDSLNNNLKNNRHNIRLYDKFLNKLYYNKDYYKIVMDGKTSIGKRVSSLYQDIFSTGTVPYRIKYDNGWLLNSYMISRSVIDSFNRFDVLEGNYDRHVKYSRDLYFERKKVYDKLITLCGGEYRQLSIFDMGLDEKDITPKSTTKKKSEAITNVVSDDDKRNFVMTSFFNLDVECFEIKKDSKDKSYYAIKTFDDIPLDDYKILEKGLPKGLVHNMYLYHFHKHRMSLCESWGDSSVLYEDMQYDLRDITRDLDKGHNLDRTYAFFLVYNRIKDEYTRGDGSYKKTRDKK